ncbi:hypothetical protein EGW08_023524 [Elysia chlorotica]|uniref:Fibrinogen C-terminal domain-containing protein n=1 Tax=Elysia chlorotica TaxID=188477 RepID=A0A433SIF0_ELYCH|nr:hypothetical protein EGW08_023524 [Elysia chlorotica]
MSYSAAISNFFPFRLLAYAQVLECKRGMGDDVTKWYQPYVKVTDSATENPLLCDTHTDGGGWIVIQRRINGDEDFYRGWDDYRNGFGSIDGDFWIGNEFINTLTNENEYELRIDMKVDGKDEFAYSSNFSLTDEADSYRLKLGKVWGTVSAKGLEYQKDQQFTTFDVDHDTWPAGNCAEKFHGAWWYQACHHSNLNGAWNQTGPTGVAWISGGSWINPTFTEMKMRRVASLVLAE